MFFAGIFYVMFVVTMSNALPPMPEPKYNNQSELINHDNSNQKSTQGTGN